MRQIIHLGIILLGYLLPGAVSNAENTNHCKEHILWYDKPASRWEETLPIGNGRLGMMPDGGIEKESIVLNEISMWSGCENDYSNPDAAASLPLIRELLQEGKNDEAQEVMYKRFVPHKPTDGGTYGTYQILSFLNIRYYGIEEDKITEYRRELDLSSATAYTGFVHKGIKFQRKYFISKPKDLIVIEFSSSSAKSVSFDIKLDRNERGNISITEDGCLKIEGELDSGAEGIAGIKYCAFAKIIGKGGKETTKDGCRIGIEGADKAWILVSCSTSYFEKSDYEQVAKRQINDKVTKAYNKEKAFTTLYNESVTAHQKLYNRASVSIASTTPSSYLPTDERLYAYAEGSPDHSLAALYYNYGRYLLICSTRPGSLPPNLQGLWADTIQTPWNGDYHTNINIQMNHWIAEQGNLSELHLPLTELVMNMIPSGEKTAKDFYGNTAQGWVQHMMTNVWNYTAPGEHPSWGATNTGGAWLCAHLWEHYLYTLDKQYLSRVYPAMEGASRFFISTMITDKKYGYLVTGPTSSPENAFYMPGSRTAVSICLGPTMDNQIVRELFTNTIDAARIIGKENSFTDSLRTALERIAPERISRDGYLMEWLEDYEETDIHHRHVSHLYGLHPGSQITPSKTPELAQACKVTLNRRGDEATGWSRAWKLNFWARLADGDRALKLLKSLLSPALDRDKSKDWTSGTFPNLFCSHPPFQIDGNFGGAAGIGEMLVQSHEGYINVLPALPSEWKEGSLKGFKVRGGAEIDLDWKNGKVCRIHIRQSEADTVKLKIGEKFIDFKGTGNVPLTGK